MSRKSVGAAFVLALFFGPFGALYGSVIGGLILIAGAVLVGSFTFGVGALILWPVALLVGTLGASAHNTRVDAAYRQQVALAEYQARLIAIEIEGGR